jgi:hypothetical protein
MFERDALGRIWMTPDTTNPDLLFTNGKRAYHRAVVVDLCGPLTTIVSKLARVRVVSDSDAHAFFDGKTHVRLNEHGIASERTNRAAAAVFPVERAEEIAAAHRTVGYFDAAAEVAE